MRVLHMLSRLFLPRTTRLLEQDRIEDAVRAARFAQQREECQEALRRMEEQRPSEKRVSETFLVTSGAGAESHPAGGHQ